MSEAEVMEIDLTPEEINEAIDFKERVKELAEEAAERQQECDSAKTVYQNAKKAADHAKQKLVEAIREEDRDYPLFDQPKQSKPPAWHETPIEEIDFLASYAEQLEAMDVKTAKDMVEFFEEGYDFEEINGVGTATNAMLELNWQDWLKEAEQQERIANEPWREKATGNLLDYGVKDAVVNKLIDADLPLLDDVDQCKKRTEIDGIGPVADEAIEEALNTIKKEPVPAD